MKTIHWNKQQRDEFAAKWPGCTVPSDGWATFDDEGNLVDISTGRGEGLVEFLRHLQLSHEKAADGSGNGHTRGPVAARETAGHETHGQSAIYSQHDGRDLATVYGREPGDAERLAACWNACEGMEDPEAEIVRLRAVSEGAMAGQSDQNDRANRLQAERDEALDALGGIHALAASDRATLGTLDRIANGAAAILRKHGRL